MNHFVVFLILIGFAGKTHLSFGDCISLPCDDANIKLGEPNYKFIDFSYANKIGEQIQFLLEKTGHGNCNSFNAEITDEDDRVVLSEGTSAYMISAQNQI